MTDTIYYIPWQVKDEVFIRIREILEQFSTYNTPRTREMVEHRVEMELQQLLHKGIIKEYSFDIEDMRFQPMIEWTENSLTLINI